MSAEQDLKFRIKTHLELIYPDLDQVAITERLVKILELKGTSVVPPDHQNLWSEKDAWLITYGDSIISGEQKPLLNLYGFLSKHLKGVVNGVHILPFFPYSSDDGFSVIDYSQVNDSLGEWQHIEKIGKSYRLMADLVINHCSSRSRWFDNFKQGKQPGLDYFVTASPSTDVSKVVRPRTSPLLREVQTLDGLKHVWCTFSHDQVDLNFRNPDVLYEMVGIIKQYIDAGIDVFRLDAVAFLWKEIGTSCVHLPETHEVIRLLRTLMEHYAPDTIIITETNVPNHENLSYFGNANEAHAIYNFSLPPLVLHAMVTGSSQYLKTWLMSMPPAQMGTFYFNFLASHDGIGLRPVEGLLEQKEIDTVVNTMQQFGARISWRSVEGGQNRPYEINTTFFDAMQGTSEGPDQWQKKRFLCAHAIMFALEGVPGIYIHSFVGTQNYIEGVNLTNQNRTINRYKWDAHELEKALQQEGDSHKEIFDAIRTVLKVRCRQPAFHPNAVQFTLHMGEEIFGFWRQSHKRDQSIFCLYNVTDKTVKVPVASINLISMDEWTDLISGQIITDIREDLELQAYDYVWLTNKAF